MADLAERFVLGPAVHLRGALVPEDDAIVAVANEDMGHLEQVGLLLQLGDIGAQALLGTLGFRAGGALLDEANVFFLCPAALGHIAGEAGPEREVARARER